jgi:hypothetical protein
LADIGYEFVAGENDGGDDDDDDRVEEKFLPRLEHIQTGEQFPLKVEQFQLSDNEAHHQKTDNVLVWFFFWSQGSEPEVLDGRDQLPLGPHANRVLMHRRVDDLKSDKRRQAEILKADADLGGTLSDHADVRRGGDDFVDTARTLFGTGAGAIRRQPGDRRK